MEEPRHLDAASGHMNADHTHGYSGTPPAKKLGIADGLRVRTLLVVRKKLRTKG